MQKKYIFPITPQTNVRSTFGDRIYFKIPRERLRPAGLKRLLRLEKYNKYKVDLLALAKKLRFTHPEQGGHLTFYIPVPKSWKKYKKEQMHMMLHKSRPDWDNLAKAWGDGLMNEDKGIADIRVTKKWVNQENGWIEFTIDLPDIRSNDNLI